MNKIEFMEKVAAGVKANIADIESTEIVSNIKANDQTYDGIIFKFDGNDVAPAYYMEAAYEEYQNGGDIEDIIESLTNAVDGSRETPKELECDVLDFEQIKDKLFVQLMNLKQNKGYLSEAVYEPEFGVYALVPKILIEHNENGAYTCLIKESMLEEYGCSKEELMEQAKVNFCKLMVPELKTVHSIMMEYFGIEAKNLLEEDVNIEDEPYALTNSNKFFGASLIFCGGIADMIGEVIKGNYYVAPSSVHELIIVKESTIDIEGIKELVNEANSTVVEPENYLGDVVMRYDYDTKTLATV